MKIMQLTFPIGGISPLSAWEGETLNFTVESNLGERARFTKRAIPSPKGRTSIDEKTGLFTYVPSPEDKEAFSVWVRARVGAKEESQKFYITPHPRIPSDFNVLEHVSGEPPDPASRFYTAFSEEADEKAIYFNRTGLDNDAKVTTKKVTVAGAKLVIEENNKDKGSLYNRLKDRKDLRQLTLCADEVVIRCELNVPGTDVYIYARRLKFEDAGGKTGRIVTTPLPYGVPSKREIALDGQKAGDVHLYVESLETPGNAHRIITTGGTGQEGRHGIAGDNGASVKTWDGKVKVKDKEFDFSEEVKRLIAASEFPTGKAIMVHVSEGENHRKGTEPKFDFPVSDVWPTNGKDPALMPGLHGRGGDGGSVFTQFEEQLKSRVQLRGGDYGKKPPTVEASKPGEPVHAIRFWFVYKVPFFSSPERVHFAILDYQTMRPGKRGEPPMPPPRPIPNRGKLSPLPASLGRFPWLHPAAVRAVISYAKDAYLSGHTGDARGMLAAHLEAVRAAGEADGWPILRSQLASIVEHIENLYDPFGNPAGWVPMLSFQANLALYKTELDGAVRAMFIDYWIQHEQAAAEKAAELLEKASKRLHAETEQALADYRAAEEKVGRLTAEMGSIAEQIESTRKTVSSIKNDLVKQVKDDLKQEKMLRASTKILGGVMQLVPVGQPVLGSVGKALTVLGDVDVDEPAASISGVAGAFAPVMTDVVGPKLKEEAKKKAETLFGGLMQSKQLAETEENTKKKEAEATFNKAVEKKEFENKVKVHLEQKDAAKKTITGAFSEFTVSEDDVKKRLEKVLADVPAYGAAVRAIDELNRRKRAFAEEMFATIGAVDAAAETIINNQSAILELRAQRELELGQLNLEALQSVQDMGRRARERLLLYQYYVLKSYHYLVLEDLPEMDFRLQKLFDAFDGMIKKKDKGTESKNSGSMLTDEQFKTLSGVFQQQLAGIAQKIIEKFQTGAFKKYLTERSYELTPTQIETLNGDGKEVEIDLLPRLIRTHEDIRITDVKTITVELAEPLPGVLSDLYLDYVHDGVSKVRRNGRILLFRSGQYRIEGKAGEKVSEAPRTDIHWGTKVSYTPPTQEQIRKALPNEKVRGKVEVKPVPPDPEVKSLILDLIGAPKDEKSPMTSFRPGMWAKLAIKRSGDEGIKLKKLVLEVQYVFRPLNDREYTTVVVRLRDDAQPYIRCDAADANGGADGVGSFLRTFRKSEGHVTFTAPPRYGSRAFRGWLKGAAAESDEPVKETDLIPGQSLKLDLKTSDYIVEPVYAPVTETPVNDKGEEWPACPVGWGFEDWMFVNGTGSEVTVTDIAFGLPQQQREAALVNEPQGGFRVKYSFERLKLLRGEATKLSVCLKPDSFGTDKAGFVCQASGNNYYVGFDMEGRPQDFERGGRDASKSFDVDAENRVLTFARP